MKRTWTEHVASECRRCARPFRVSVEAIAEMREQGYTCDAMKTDAELAADLDLCLSCQEGKEVKGEHDGLAGTE